MRTEARDHGREQAERETARHRQGDCSSAHVMLFYDHTSSANGVLALRSVVKDRECTR
ncbi:MAG: hypothetical protein WBM04_13675 [Candidatus Korobacteraceae bacterium]